MATGKYAKAICDRTGWKIPYRNLTREWTGVRVKPTEWEARHPQLELRRNVTDGESLFDPRPDNDNDSPNGPAPPLRDTTSPTFGS